MDELWKIFGSWKSDGSQAVLDWFVILRVFKDLEDYNSKVLNEF